MPESEAHRELSRLLGLLDGPRPSITPALAENPDASGRTIDRDQERFDPPSEPTGSDATRELPSTLSVHELTLALVAIRALQVVSSPTDSVVLLSAILKLFSFLPTGERFQVAQLLRMFQEEAVTSASALQDDMLLTVLRAANEQKPISILFANDDGQLVKSTLTVSGVRPSAAEWMLQGTCHGSPQYQGISLGRIQSLRMDT